MAQTNFIPPQTIYLALDGKTIVAEGDERAAMLLAAANLVVPDKLANRFDLWSLQFPIEAGKEAKRSKSDPVPPTISPEEITSRATRPAKAQEKR